MIRQFVVFGATGDLTSRYLLPAIAKLFEAGHLPPDLRIRGAAWDDYNTESYRKQLDDRLSRLADVPEDLRPQLLDRIDYVRADVSKPQDVRAAIGDGREPVVFYLALPPQLFAPTLESLAATGIPEGSRIVVEKPFGYNHQSARELNQLIHRTFPEEAVFRVDHFLGIQTVQNVIGLRFANRIFEPLWSRAHISRVEIIWDETVALEGRAGYYDRSGALQDMIQNHLLQVLCLIAMEAPISLGERDFRDRKMDVLRAIRRPKRENLAAYAVRARYTQGEVCSRSIPNYTDEPGVDPSRNTETFAQIALAIDNWRWAGVPFVLRSGKALGQARRLVNISFQHVPHLAFCGGPQPRHNFLQLSMDPDRVLLHVNVNGPGESFTLRQVDLDADLAPQEFPAYGRLLLDILNGEPMLSIRADEAEESWRIIDPIIDAWKSGAAPVLEYPAGSGGPEIPALFPGDLIESSRVP